MVQKRFISAWRDAAEMKNTEALEALLAEQAELISPVTFQPLTERAKIVAVFRAIGQVLPDLSYTRCEKTETGAIMIFEGTIRGTPLRLEGIDVFTLGLDGRAYGLKVFVRPLKAANAFAEAMSAALAAVS
jgi:hypothetical protein